MDHIPYRKLHVNQIPCARAYGRGLLFDISDAASILRLLDMYPWKYGNERGELVRHDEHTRVIRLS